MRLRPWITVTCILLGIAALISVSLQPKPDPNAPEINLIPGRGKLGRHYQNVVFLTNEAGYYVGFTNRVRH